MSNEIGIARKQSVFAVLETTIGALKFPAGTDFILPAGNAVMNQSPDFVDSEELRDSLDILDQFQNSTPPGEFNIPMYVRPSGTLGSVPQGDAMFQSMQGMRSLMTAELSAGIDASVATIAYDTALAGHVMPDQGIVLIGTEEIYFTGKVATTLSASTGTLTGCTRGYNGTTAATALVNASIELKSVFYAQRTIAPSFSLWIKTDHFLQGMSGCTINNAVLGVNNEGAVMFTMKGQGMQMVWAGKDELQSTSAGSATTLSVEDADRYSAGAYIQNSTQSDTNTGAGYLIASVNNVTNEVIISAHSAAWATADVIEGYLPTGTEIGAPIESRRTAIELNSVSATFRNSDLTFDVPKQYLTDEVGTEFPQGYLEDKRSVSSNMNLYFRQADARYFSEGYSGNEVPVKLTFGNTIGSKLVVYMKRSKLKVPTIEFASPAIHLAIPLTALGTLGEDSAEIRFE